MILGITADGRVDFCAGSPEDICGLTPDELVGCRVTIVTGRPPRLLVTPKEPDSASHETRDAVTAGTSDWSGVRLDEEHEAELVCADGTSKMVTVRLGKRYTERPDGDTLLSYVVVVDQTDARMADLMATASHELRTPVTSILGYAELLRSSPNDVPPATMRQLLGRIDRNARRLRGLIEDMLMVSQVEGGGFRLEMRDLDLREPLNRALDEIRTVIPVRELVLHTDISDRPVPVLGDADRLERAFAHLLDNAVKFSLVGEAIDVSVGVEGEEAVVSVMDRGVGIEDAEQPRIFERFFRGSRARELVTQGSGLGLTVTSAVVSSHGGSVEVDSSPGHGTCFIVRIPLQS